MSCPWGSQNTYPRETQTHPDGTARRWACRGAPRLPSSPAGVRAATQTEAELLAGPLGLMSPPAPALSLQEVWKVHLSGRADPRSGIWPWGAGRGASTSSTFYPPLLLASVPVFFLQGILLLPSADGLVLSIRDRTPLPTPAQGWAGDQPASLSHGPQLLSSELQGSQTAGAVASCRTKGARLAVICHPRLLLYVW